VSQRSTFWKASTRSEVNHLFFEISVYYNSIQNCNTHFLFMLIGTTFFHTRNRHQGVAFEIRSFSQQRQISAPYLPHPPPLPWLSPRIRRAKILTWRWSLPFVWKTESEILRIIQRCNELEQCIQLSTDCQISVWLLPDACGVCSWDLDWDMI
jgi:hypothetical protein